VAVSVQSYNQMLYFGLTGDAAAAPDVGRLRDFLDESFTELRKAAGLPAAEIERPALVAAPPALKTRARAGSPVRIKHPARETAVPVAKPRVRPAAAAAAEPQVAAAITSPLEAPPEKPAAAVQPEQQAQEATVPVKPLARAATAR
jgi:uncharacterized protein DUF1298